MFANKDFLFDGQQSTDYGISIARATSDMFEVPWIGGQDISEEYIPYKDKPTFYKTALRPIEFTLTFSKLDEELTSEDKESIAKWLIRREYCDFQTTDDMRKVLKIIAISDVKFTTADDKYGYFNITYRALPYAYSPIEISTFDLTASQPNTIEIYNYSNVYNPYGQLYYEPELWIDLRYVTGVTLTNLSDSNRIFQLSSLAVSESVYINNAQKEIVSDTGFNRLSNIYNYQFLRLVYGLNRITVDESCIIQFKCQYPIYF